jgi:hypothetical protein
MALISFFAGENDAINDLSGSGLGFYGSGGYAASVQVGQHADTCYITNSTGTASNAIKVDHIKWVDNASGQLAGGEIRALRNIPNKLANLEVRFTHSTPVKTQNAQLRIFDRTNIDNPAVGVLTKVAVLVHPWDTNSPVGSGSLSWHTPGGSGSVVNIGDFPAAISPGSGGWSPQGANTTDTTHSWFFGISSMPDSIGSKNYALYFSLEFL